MTDDDVGELAEVGHVADGIIDMGPPSVTEGNVCVDDEDEETDDDVGLCSVVSVADADGAADDDGDTGAESGKAGGAVFPPLEIEDEEEVVTVGFKPGEVPERRDELLPAVD